MSQEVAATRPRRSAAGAGPTLAPPSEAPGLALSQPALRFGLVPEQAVLGAEAGCDERGGNRAVKDRGAQVPAFTPASEEAAAERVAASGGVDWIRDS